MFVNIAVSLPASDLKEIIRHLPWLYYHSSDNKLRDINNKKYLSFTIDDAGRVSAIQVWRNKKTFAKLLTNLPDHLSNALRYKGLPTIFEPSLVEQEALLNKLSVYIKNHKFDRALGYLADNPIAIKSNVIISSNSAFFYALLIRQFQKKSSEELEKIIYSLRKKNCKLSIFTEFDLLKQEDLPERDALLQQEEQLFNTAMLVGGCLQGNVDSNQLFLEQMQQSILWKQSEPEFTPELMPLDAKQFEGTLKDSPHFEGIASYFIAVKNLFLQPDECLKHLSQLEKRLSSELPQLKLANNKPHAYLFDGKLSWPLPEGDYQWEPKLAADQKDGKLLTILAEELSKHSIVEKGFWHTFLYVNPEIALEMLANGDLFVEKNYFPIANNRVIVKSGV